MSALLQPPSVAQIWPITIFSPSAYEWKYSLSRKFKPFLLYKVYKCLKVKAVPSKSQSKIRLQHSSSSIPLRNHHSQVSHLRVIKHFIPFPFAPFPGPHSLAYLTERSKTWFSLSPAFSPIASSQISCERSPCSVRKDLQLRKSLSVLLETSL